MAGVSIKFKAVDEISARFEAMFSEGEKALDAFERLGNGADLAYSAVVDGTMEAADAIDKATKSTDYWTDAIGNYDKGAMEAVYTTEELVEMGFKTEEALSELADSVDKATEELDKFGRESEEVARRSEKFGDESKQAVIGLEDVLVTAGIVTALHEIGDAFMDCSDVAAKFETSMAQVSTIADSAVLSTEEISGQINLLSRDTAVAVTDLAEATYGAISASVDTANAVAFVAQSNELAVGGFTSQATAVDVLTTALNAYELSADRATQISDYLVTTQNLGKTTVDQLASSIGMVIPSAAAFNVEMDNLTTAYAIMTANGIQTAQSTTYLKSMFTELASTESEVATVLQEETGKSFADLMEIGYSLGDVMDILGDSVDGNTTAFMNMWSSMEAGSGAVSLYNAGAEKFAQVLDEMQHSAGATALAYETMTNTTEFSSQRMENSFANLSIAIGDDLNPTVAALQNGIADIVDGFTDIVTEYPAISGALSGAAISLGVVTVGVGGYTLATKAATLATKAWTEAMKMNPVFLAVTAVTALTAGLVAYCAVTDESVDITEEWTNATQKQYEELENLRVEYETAVDTYGEASEQALSLRYEMDQLSQSFEENEQTLGEFIAECESVSQAHYDLVQSFDDTAAAIREEELGNLSLIQRLSELSSSTEQTAGSQLEMEAIINNLNGSIDGLNLSYSDLITNQESAVASLEAMARLQAEEEMRMAAYEQYVNLLKEVPTLQAELDKAEAELTAAREEETAALEAYNKAQEECNNRMSYYGGGGIALAEMNAWNDASEAVKYYEEQYEKALANMKDNTAEQEEIVAGWEDISQAATTSAEEQISAVDAVATATVDAKYAIEELATAYDEAYMAAYDSINGQIGLFDTMKTECEQSVTDMEVALQSQIDYLNLYTENLQKASEYGLNESLISSLADGSAESAGQLDAIIAKIEALGGTTEGMSEDARVFVDSFNTSFAQVDEAKQSFADTVAQMETDFADSIDEIGADMEEAVKKMTMADEAKQAAMDTLDGYIAGIKEKIPEVNSALAAVEWANSNISTFSEGINGYAVGTSSAEPGLALVGENGPELVDFRGGERVYTSDETSDILSGTGGRGEFYVAPSEAEGSSESGGDKTITLRLEGAGEMKVGSGGMSKEDVVEVLMENVKDVLMEIIRQEILEEGDLSYEF